MIEFDEPISDLLDALRDPAAPLRAALIYRLSSPSPGDFEALQAAWSDVPVERRRLLLSRLAEMSETSFEVDFSQVALFALDDEDQGVRRLAIEALWENELPATMLRMIHILQGDEAAEVRAAAAQSLGRFVLAGELGTLPTGTAQAAEAALLEVWAEISEAAEVRRRALESISYSGRDEVPSLILEALEDSDLLMQASAIFSMGRSADEQWESYVQQALSDPESEVRYEAARAAGELFLIEAVPQLIDMLEEIDRDIQHAAIWSLGEIGGVVAQRALLSLADRETDEDILEAVEDAINSAALSTGDFAAYLVGRDLDELPALDEIDELDEIDDLYGPDEEDE
jgi:hypothetical protein